MSNQGIKNKDVNGTITTISEGVVLVMHGVFDLASASGHQATKSNKRENKMGTLNKNAVEDWIRSEPTRRKYR